MSIITPSDFTTGEQVIAQLSNIGVQQSVQGFIDEYEPEFLKELLGVTLYNEFITGLIPVPVDPPTDPETFEPIPDKWIELRDEMDLKYMIKCYVYVHYMENLTTTTTGTSEVKSKNENSTPVNGVDKQVKAWNRMVKKVRLFDLSTTIYPDYVRFWWRRYDYWYYGCEFSEIYYFRNTLGF